MRSCPYCGVVIESAPSAGTASIEESGKVATKAIEHYTCQACGRKFGVIGGRTESLLISAKAVEEIRVRLGRALAANESLRKKASQLASETRSLKASLKTARETAYSKSLQGRMTELERHVESLKKEKGRLEEQLARMG
jgi:predicted RNase H-like nuclease (RuvC/YqgF family)